MAETRAKNDALKSVTRSGAGIIKWGIVALGLDAITSSSGSGSDVSNYVVSGEGNNMNVDSFKSGTDNIMDSSQLTGSDVTDGDVDNSDRSIQN